MGARRETNATIPNQTEIKHKQNNSVTRVGGGSKMAYATPRHSRNTPETQRAYPQNTPGTTIRKQTETKHKTEQQRNKGGGEQNDLRKPETLQKQPGNTPKKKKEKKTKHS